MLGEFFAARAGEVDDALVEGGPFGRYETVEAKTVSSVSIATLGEILGVGTYDDVFEATSAGRQAPDGESGIDPVPSEVTTALVRATDLDAVADAWAKTEEMAAWDQDDVRDVIRQLAALTAKAWDTKNVNCGSGGRSSGLTHRVLSQARTRVADSHERLVAVPSGRARLRDLRARD